MRFIAATGCRHVKLTPSTRQSLRDLGMSYIRSECDRGVAFCSPTDWICRRQGLTFVRSELFNWVWRAIVCKGNSAWQLVPITVSLNSDCQDAACVLFRCCRSFADFFFCLFYIFHTFIIPVDSSVFLSPCHSIDHWCILITFISYRLIIFLDHVVYTQFSSKIRLICPLSVPSCWMLS